MDKYSSLTAIEILKLINDVEKKHIEKKTNVLKYLNRVEDEEEQQDRERYINQSLINIEKIRDYIGKIIALYEKINNLGL